MVHGKLLHAVLPIALVILAALLLLALLPAPVPHNTRESARLTPLVMPGR
jgi:hypothetical protein